MIMKHLRTEKSRLPAVVATPDLRGRGGLRDPQGSVAAEHGCHLLMRTYGLPLVLTVPGR